MSALFRWPCGISIHLSARSVAAGVRPFPLATRQFYSFVCQVCHCWRPPFSTGHHSISSHVSPRSVTAGVRPFPLAISISIHVSPRSVTAGVRPFPLAMQHFYSLVSQVCHCWCPPFSTGHAAFLFIVSHVHSLLLSPMFGACAAGVLPFPLAMQHFKSFVSCLPVDFFTFVTLISVCMSPRFCACTAGVRPFRWPCSISIHLSPM